MTEQEMEDIKTQLSKFDCKKALEMFDGDYTRAFEFIMAELDKPSPFAEYGNLFSFARNNTEEKKAANSAKAWLNRAFRIKERIQSAEENMEFWHQLATRCVSNPSQTIGMGTGKRVEDNCVKILTALRENEDRLIELITVKREVEYVISYIKDPVYNLLLTARYLNFEGWADIADKMRTTEQYVKQDLHNKALRYAKAAIDVYNDNPHLREHWMNPTENFKEEI